MASFTGELDFCSNFYTSVIVVDNLWFDTVEHMFQAAKTLDPEERHEISCATTPGRAKRLGRSVTLRPDWEDVKFNVMRLCLSLKFPASSNNYLTGRLLKSGDTELVEVNEWGDKIWGVCDGEGENWLGRLLMERRAQLQSFLLPNIPEPIDIAAGIFARKMIELEKENDARS